MTTGTMHFARVERSPRLQRIVELLMKADAPMSAMEITLQAFVPNASTDINEIRKNEGYTVVTLRGKDGVWRYWLAAAPGWMPRWIVDKNGTIIPAKTSQKEVECDEAQPVPSSRTCKACGRVIEVDDGRWVCNDECREEWKRQIFTNKVQQDDQGSLL